MPDGPETADGRRRTPVEIALSAGTTAAESAADAAQRAAVAGDRLADAAAADVGTTPSEVVHEEHAFELRRYEPLTDEQHDVPVLVVYALINRPYVLDLQPDRSVVRRLLEAGLPVYLVDWAEPSYIDQHLGLYDYVERFLDRCVDVVRERAGSPTVNLLGYCMGGTTSVVYAALHPRKVNALGLLAAGVRFDDTGGVLELWGDRYDPRAVTRAFGNVPGEFLDVGFAAMDPVANYLTKHLHLLDELENEDFVRNFARMERWLGESVDVAGEVYAEFVEELYQDDALYEGDLTVGGERVDLANLDAPVLQIVGEYDHLVPPAASTPLADVVGGEVTTVAYPAGHVGMAVSRAAHRDVWPEVAEWFVDQSAGAALADVVAEGVERALGVDVETDVTVGAADEVAVAVADEGGAVARAVVRHDTAAVVAFLEEALGVAVGVDAGPGGIAVSVETADGVTTTVVESAGAAVRTEVEEAVAEVDVAASYELEDVEGIGPTYAGRLRAAGIDSPSALAVADPSRVAEAAETSERLAGDLVGAARELVGAGEPVEMER